MKDKVSCIIPAYNEGERIANVIKAIQGNHLIGEIIVVNDGSSDNTEEVLKKITGIKIISYDNNRGKSFAVLKGLNSSKYSFILLIDADLEGLTNQNINDIIEPVLSKKVDVTMALTKKPLICRIIGIDPLSGQRAFDKRIFLKEGVFDKARGYLLESVFNDKIIKLGCKIKIVNWLNVNGPYKTEKEGFLKGWRDQLKMIIFIGRHTKYIGWINQTIKLKSLEVNNFI